MAAPAATVLALLGCAGGDRASRATTPAAGAPAVTAPAAPAPKASGTGAAGREPKAEDVRRGRWAARLLRPAILRTAPGGRRVARVGLETGYALPRVMAVAALRPGWVGVRALQRPNGELGWLPADAVRLTPVRTTLVADLSDRELTLRVGGAVRHRVPVGIGRPGSETPLGRYGVTDRLRGGDGPSPYGCCIIPLTGHQPDPPPGWTGGTRLALHGTPSQGSVGQEVSAGCLRMRDADIRRLLREVPLGATLVVRA